MENQVNNYITVAYKLYQLQGEERQLIEEATKEQPFLFISGFGIALPAFELNVLPVEAGQSFSFSLEPKDAYGERDEEQVVEVNKQVFTINGHFDHDNIYPDAVVPLQNEEGQRFFGRVKEVRPDTVVMDLNHPLAGMTLLFEGHVIENREATNKEIEQMINHMHGGCGCGCDDCDHDSCGDDHECGCGHCH